MTKLSDIERLVRYLYVSKGRRLLLLLLLIAFPLAFCILSYFERGGSVSLYTFIGTEIRLYLSDSGNLCVASRNDRNKWDVPPWQVSRKEYVPYILTNCLVGYLDSPRLVLRLLFNREQT